MLLERIHEEAGLNNGIVLLVLLAKEALIVWRIDLVENGVSWTVLICHLCEVNNVFIARSGDRLRRGWWK